MCAGFWGEDVETSPKDAFEFTEANIVGGDKGVEKEVMGGLWGYDDMKKEGTGNFLDT